MHILKNILKVLGFIALFCLTIIGIYYLMRLAIRDEIQLTMQETMRQEFIYDRQNYKLIIEG